MERWSTVESIALTDEERGFFLEKWTSQRERLRMLDAPLDDMRSGLFGNFD